MDRKTRRKSRRRPPSGPRWRLRSATGFHVHGGNRHAQAASMVIAPGDAEGDSRNRHRGSDQWLFVVAGRGVAILAGSRVPLAAGTLLLIGRGVRHEVRNTGRRPLRTLNLYVPPAYDRAGNELPRGRR